MCIIYLVFCLVLVSAAKKNDDSLKDEFCTDPRTMRKHAAYTEWADAYSCTRHRCQPGGRNLAIYTVGCKRVEAPESAIECEEVVEDTNMQFPYCCTRLRCLVVVRGEVWTRVLGQPWETLPAAPWSHMYKMKKPPPVDGGFLPKGPTAGPVYELSQEPAVDRRAGIEKDCDKPKLRASTPASVPDIVIALTTNNEKKPTEAEIDNKFLARADEDRDQPNEIEAEEAPTFTEKVPDIVSEERTYDKKRSRDPKKSLFDQEASYEYTNSKKKEKKQKMSLFGHETSDEYTNSRNKEKKQKMSLFGHETSDEYTNSKKKLKKQKANAISDEFFTNTEKNTPRGPTPWDQIPPKQWNTGLNARASTDHTDSEEKADKPASLQHLVNAIGTRMRDIESVVQKMSEKVQPESAESRRADRPIAPHLKSKDSDPAGKAKPSNVDYNTFPLKQSGSRYLHGAADATSEPPLFVGDRMSGYFSDPSNNLLRRSMGAHGPKEPHETYMAPVNNDHHKPATDSAEPEIKHKKRAHKKKKSKHSRRKHHREEREKEFSKITDEKNAVSLEDSNDLGTGTTQKIVEEPEPEQLEETHNSHLGSTSPVNYWAMPNSPIAAPMKNRPITHRYHNRPGRVRLGFDTASRNEIINNMRKLRTERFRYRNL